jgi:hypothetical protein
MPPKSRKKKAEATWSSARRKLQLDTKSPPQPLPAKVVDLTDSPKKQRVDPFPPKKLDAAVVTPPKSEPPTKRTRVEKKDEYVPSYIHKNVDYKRKGKADLSDETLEAYELVEKHFHIPDGFENSRNYGPLSGTSFEERVISAYSLGLLEPKTKESANVAICSVCAVEGHLRSDCPKLI